MDGAHNIQKVQEVKILRVWGMGCAASRQMELLPHHCCKKEGASANKKEVQESHRKVTDNQVLLLPTLKKKKRKKNGNEGEKITKQKDIPRTMSTKNNQVFPVSLTDIHK